MTAKILVTLIWIAVLIGVNKLLADTDWPQYVATFFLAGAYALLIDKLNKRAAQDGEN
ncbi:hypothetical protein [Streptomyces sp. NRRL S-646]|uniref:hypothetical protein n=1 Tax=Streptomyces sp. NRRL S-646 TaxID=1463917 RepID=UPI001331424F|nr:hypothetical protein [Streptomyces sp. NRRL S-646]